MMFAYFKICFVAEEHLNIHDPVIYPLSFPSVLFLFHFGAHRSVIAHVLFIKSKF